jgi:hypothetical protein
MLDTKNLDKTCQTVAESGANNKLLIGFCLPAECFHPTITKISKERHKTKLNIKQLKP